MILHNLHFQIIIRSMLIFVLALGAGISVILTKSYLVASVFLLVEIPVVYHLISYLNTTNRKISYFLESVQNNDSALLFTNRIANKSIKELYHGLTKVNRQIQELKIRNLEREQYFQILLEQVPTGIVTFNSKGFVLHANSGARKMFSMEVLTHVNQLERIDRNLFNAVKNINAFEQKLVALTNERGKCELLLKAASFKSGSEDLMLLSIQDIRNELDENELNSWMKLIRVLMHEMMNSIAPITSLSESMSKFLTIDGRSAIPQEIDECTIETILEGLNVINEQGKGLMTFVESFRRLTRLPTPVKKTFRIEDLINRIKVLYSSLENSEKVTLTTLVNPPEMEILADENLVSQVLLNLLKNALESIEDLSNAKIRISVRYTSTNRPEICVSDNGPGIPGEIIEQIFVPFFTTRANGSGIGLSLSRQIMRMHGGSLLVRSIPKHETVFSMIF